MIAAAQYSYGGKGELGMKFGNKKALLMALVAIAGFGTYRLGTHVFGAQQFRFSLDRKLSPSMQKAIKEAVYESYITALSSLSETISKVCSALEHISIERRANNKIYITAKSADPYVRISELVLTSSGLVLDKACFTHEVLQPLPTIIQKNLLGKVTITDEFKQWLLRLDPSVFAFYEIIWTDDFSIELHDKHNEKQTILCSVTTIPDKNLRELCQRIFDEKIICAQGTARKYAYTADIRFEKQIIICSHKGGAVHG